MPWSELLVIDNPEPVEPHPEAVAALGRIAISNQQAERRWRSWLHDNGIEVGERQRCDAARRASSSTDRPPNGNQPTRWLASALGPRPDDQAGATIWNDTIRRIATWRQHYEIEADVALLGPRPEHPATVDAWTTETISVMHSAVWLNQRPANPAVTTRLSGPQLLARRRELHALLESVPRPLGPLLTDLVSSSDASTAVPGRP